MHTCDLQMHFLEVTCTQNMKQSNILEQDADYSCLLAEVVSLCSLAFL